MWSSIGKILLLLVLSLVSFVLRAEEFCAPEEIGSQPQDVLLDVEAMMDPALPAEEEVQLAEIPVSIRAEEAKQIAFRYWREQERFGSLSSEADQSFHSLWQKYGIDHRIPPLTGDWYSEQRLPEAVNSILSFYLRWNNQDLNERGVSAALPDMPAYLDPSLLELLELPADEKRLLSEIIFEDFLKSPAKRQKLLQLHRVIDLFRNQYLRVVAGLEIRDRALQAFARWPKVEAGILRGLAELPRVEEMRSFIEKYDAYYGVAKSAATFRPIYQAKMSKILAANNNRFQTSFLFEAFEFTPEDIQEFERLQALKEKLVFLQGEMEQVKTHPHLNAGAPSPYRAGASLLDHHADLIAHIQEEIGEDFVAEYQNRLEIKNLTEEYLEKAKNNMPVSQERLNFEGGSFSFSPSISGFNSHFNSRFLKVQEEVAEDFDVKAQDKNYPKYSFEGRGFADPKNFLPEGARYKSNGRWEVLEVYRGDRGTGIFSGRQSPLGNIASRVYVELTDAEFKHYERQAILRETWRRIRAEGLAEDFGRYSLKKIVEEGSLYGSEGWYVEAYEGAKVFEWYDPILERFREPKNDVFDFDREVLPKYQLALYILNLGEPSPRFTHLPFEYSYLMFQPTENLVQLAFIREHFKNFGLPPAPKNLRDLMQKESEGIFKNVDQIVGLDRQVAQALLSYDAYLRNPQANSKSLFHADRTNFQLPVINNFERSDLERIQLNMMEWSSLVRDQVGLDVKYQFKFPADLKDSLSQLRDLIQKKRILAPGVSFSELGCFAEKSSALTLLPNETEKMTAKDYFSLRTRLSAELPQVQITNLDEFFNKISTCLERLEQKQKELQSKIAKSWESHRLLEYAKSARRVRNIRTLLEASIDGHEPNLLPEILELPENMDQITEDLFYVVLGDFINNPQVNEQVTSIVENDRRESQSADSFIKNITQRLDLALRDPNRAARLQEINEKLNLLIYTPPLELSERDHEIREKLVKLLNLADTHRLNMNPNLLGVTKNIVQDYEIMKNISFKDWTLFELDALAYLVNQHSWASVNTDTAIENLQSFDLFYWLFRNLKTLETADDGSAVELLASRPNFVSSSDIMESAEHLAVSAAALPLVWGDDWKNILQEGTEELSPTRIRTLGIEAASQVLNFVIQRQQQIQNYIWNRADSQQRPMQVSSGLSKAYQVTHEDVQVLSRWKVPTDPEHLEGLLRFGDEVVWEEVVKAYIEAGDIKDKEKRIKAVQNSRDFPPQEVVDWYLNQNFGGPNLNSRRLNVKLAHNVFEKLDLSDNIALQPAQKAYLGNLTTQINQASTEAVAQPLLTYNEFMIDFFGDPRSPETKSIRSYFRTHTGDQIQATFKRYAILRNLGPGFVVNQLNFDFISPVLFLEMLGFDLNSPIAQSAYEQMKRDNSALARDLGDLSLRFFQEGQKLEEGPLKREHLLKIVLAANEDPLLMQALTGKVLNEIREGFDVDSASARNILEKSQISYNNREFSKIRDQLSHLRIFVNYAQELFPQYQASIGESFSNYVSMSIFQNLSQDAEFLSLIHKKEFGSALEARFKALESYLRTLGYLTEADTSFYEELLSYLQKRGIEESMDFDEFFRALHSILEIQELRFLPQSFWYGVSESDYQRQRELRLKLLKESFRLSKSDQSPILDKLIELLHREPQALRNEVDGILPSINYEENAILKNHPIGNPLSPEQARSVYLSPEYGRKISENFNQAFPRKKFSVDLVSVYDEKESSREKIDEQIQKKLELVYQSVVRDPAEQQRDLIRRSLPYGDRAKIEFPKNAPIKINPEWSVQARQKIFDFISSQDMDFFTSQQRTQSELALLTDIFGSSDLAYLQERFGAFDILGVSAGSILDDYNSYNLQLLEAPDEKLSSEQIKAFHRFVFQNYSVLYLELQSLLSLEKPSNAQKLRMEILSANLEEGYRSYFSREYLYAFLLHQGAKEEIAQNLIESSAVEIQLKQLASLADHVEEFYQLIMASNVLVNKINVQSEIIRGLIFKSREFFEVDQTLNRPEFKVLHNNQQLSFSDLEKGLRNLSKDRLEQKYADLQAYRAQRVRKDRWIITNMGADIWTLGEESVKLMGAEIYRVGVENLLVNLPSGFGFWDSDLSIGTGIAQWVADSRLGKIGGLQEISNFSKERLERDNTDLMSQILADGVGMYLTLASFGGFKLSKVLLDKISSQALNARQVVRAGVEASVRTLPASVRHQSHAFFKNAGGRLAETSLGSRLAASGQRVRSAGRSISEILTKERHGLGYRGPAERHALATATRLQSESLVALQLARPSAEAPIARIWRQTSTRAKNAFQTGRRVATPMALRATVDSLIIGGGAVAASRIAFGGAGGGKMREIFGDEFMHGFQFLTGLMLVHGGFRLLPKASKMILPSSSIRTQALIERMAPLGEKAFSAPLMVYIGSDATASITGALMTESEVFRSIVNEGLPGAFELVSLGMMDTDWRHQLTVEEREYERHLDAKYFENGIPVGWLDEFDDGEEMLNQWLLDRDRIARAISGAVIVGIITGGPFLGRAADVAVYRRDAKAREKFEETLKAESQENLPEVLKDLNRVGFGKKFYETVSTAYHGNPYRYYEWMRRDHIAKLRVENERVEPGLRKTEDQLGKEADEFIRDHYLQMYEQVHPEYQLIRLVRQWTAQGRDMEALRQATLESLRYNYQRIYNEMKGGERLNPILRGANPTLADFVKNERMMSLDEVSTRFNQAWDEGVRQGQAIRVADLQEFRAHENVMKHLESLSLLGQRLETYLVERKRSKAETADVWKILEEFGSREFWESSSGQLLLQEIIIPRVQAIERGLSTEPLFMNFNLRSPNFEGQPKLSASDFAKLIRERVRNPNESAARQKIEPSVEGRTMEWAFLSASSGETLAKSYRENSKTYLESSGIRIKLPVEVQFDVKNNGRIEFFNSATSESFAIDSSRLPDVQGRWGLTGEPVPNVWDSLNRASKNSEQALAPQIVMYDLVKIDPVTGDRRMHSEPVVLTTYGEHLSLIGLPDSSFLFSYKGERGSKPKKDFVSEIHLPNGFKLENVKEDVVVIRDRFQIETEINFAEQNVRMFVRSERGNRAELEIAKDKKPMEVSTFVQLLARNPGVLPSEAIMFSHIYENRKVDRAAYSSLNDRVLMVNMRTHLRGLSSDIDPMNVNSENLRQAYRRAVSIENNATRSEIEMGPFARELERIPLPEGASLQDLASAANPFYLARYYVTDALFVKIRDEVGYSGLSAEQKQKLADVYQVRLENLKPEQVREFETLELVKSLSAADIEKFFTAKEIRNVWRLSKRAELLKKHLDSALKITDTWALEKTIRSIGMQNPPKSLAEFQSYRSQREAELKEKVWLDHFDDLAQLIPKEAVADIIMRKGLPELDQNYFALQAEKISYETFSAYKDRLAPGVDAEAVKEGLKSENWGLLRKYLNFSDIEHFLSLSNLESARIGELTRIAPESLKNLQRELRSLEDARETFIRLGLPQN